MPTQAEMGQAFATYFKEMEDCAAHGCFWALLHVVMVMPDVCSALESETNESSGKRHVQWCERCRRTKRRSTTGAGPSSEEPCA
jgi:hypothetical protein